MKELVPYFFQGFLILGIGVVWAFSPKAPQLAVVDMKTLISTSSQSLAKSGRTSTREVQEWGDRLKEGLETYGKDHHLVLLAKGAVVCSTLPDVTEELLGFFEGGEK
jgi:hypothetical protein